MYIGLSVGPGHGKVYWEGKIAWPMEADGATAGAGAAAAGATNQSAAAGTITPGSSTPSTPRTGVPTYGQASSEVLASRNAAFQQLLHNLVTYLPPVSAALIGPAKDYSSHMQHAGGGSQAHSVPTAIPPLTPHSASSSTPSEPNTPSSAKGEPSSSSSGEGAGGAIPPQLRAHQPGQNDPMATPPRTVRRPSLTGLTLEDGWCDGEVVLSVFLLLDTIDIDSKQVTFIANHGHSATAGAAAHPQRHLEVNTLFQALYKVDLSVPAALNTQIPQQTKSTGNSRPSSAATAKQ